MKFFSKAAAIFIFCLPFVAPTIVSANEIVSGQGTAMKTEITNETHIQRTVKAIIDNPSDVYDRFGVRITAEERGQLRSLLDTGQYTWAERFVDRIVRRSLRDTSSEFLNENSNEKRTWTIFNVNQGPMTFIVDGFEGITVLADSSDFSYKTKIEFQAHQEITASIVYIGLYDVWGKPMRTIRVETMEDFEPGNHTLSLRGSFRDRNEAERFYQSLFFVDSVRLGDGTIITQDRNDVGEALRHKGSALTIPDPENRSGNYDVRRIQRAPSSSPTE